MINVKNNAIWIGKIFPNNPYKDLEILEDGTNGQFYDYLLDKNNHLEVPSVLEWQKKKVRSEWKKLNGRVAFAGTMIGNKKRSKKNITSVKAVILDLDDLTEEYNSREKIEKYLMNALPFSFVLWESVSSGVKDSETNEVSYKYKVAIELDKNIENEDHRALVSYLVKQFVDEGLLIQGDASNVNLYQAQLLPAKTQYNDLKVELYNREKGVVATDSFISEARLALKYNEEKIEKEKTNVSLKNASYYGEFKWEEIITAYMDAKGEKWFSNFNNFLSFAMNVDYMEKVEESISQATALKIMKMVACGNAEWEEGNLDRYTAGDFHKPDGEHKGIAYFKAFISKSDYVKHSNYKIEKYLNDINLLEDGTRITFDSVSNGGKKVKVDYTLSKSYASENLQIKYIREFAKHQRKIRANERKSYELAMAGENENQVARVLSKPLSAFDKEMTPSEIANFLMNTIPLIFLQPIENPKAEGQPVYAYDFSLGYYISSKDLIFRYIEAVDSEIKTYNKEEVYSKLRSRVKVIEEYTGSRFSWVNNGIFDQQSKELMPFTYNMVKTGKVVTNYVKDAPLPRFDDEYGGWDPKSGLMEFANHDDEVYELLLQVMNTSTRNVSLGKAIWLVGEGNNGKGTFQDMITFTVGGKNIAYMKVEEFSENHAMAKLEGVMVVIGDDVPADTYIDNSGNFYSVITGDVVNVNPKHKREYERRYNVTIIQSTNGMPTFANKTMGTYRRHHIVPFKADFNGRVENKKIKRDYIKRREVREWLLSEAFKLSFEDYITPEVSKRAMEEYKESNDPVADFYSDFVEEWPLVMENDEPVKVSVSLLHSLYSDWMSYNGLTGIKSKRRFTKDLERVIDDRWSKEKMRTTDVYENQLPDGYNNGELSGPYLKNVKTQFDYEAPKHFEHGVKIKQPVNTACWVIEPKEEEPKTREDIVKTSKEIAIDEEEKQERKAYGPSLMGMLDK